MTKEKSYEEEVTDAAEGLKLHKERLRAAFDTSEAFKRLSKAADEAEIGIKYDGQGEDGNPLKTRWSLLPWVEVEEVAEILTEGAVKYGSYNWTLVRPTSRYIDAAFRHLIAWVSGEKTDPESRHSHLAHLMCNILFLAWFDNNPPEDEETE